MFFSGNGYMDKIMIVTKYSGGSISSSWLTKTLIYVHLSKNVVKRQKWAILTSVHSLKSSIF